MGAHAGPDINENGLVLALDGANYRSFKGEATTNVVGNAASMSGWSPYSNGNDGTFTTEFGTTGYKMVNRGSWNGIYKGITLPATGTYTISAWFRYWGGASDNNGATVYTNGGGISDTAVALDKSKVGVWQRVSMTRTYSTTSLGFYLISYGGTAGASNSTWDVTMPQIEQKSYATTFTDATRGTTVATGGGWEDLTGNGNNVELVNGVRESADNLGSLSFDGVDDYISTSYDLSWNNTNSVSISMYVKPNSLSAYYPFIGKGPSNWEWQIMQKNTSLEFIYWNTAGGHTNGPIPEITNFFSSTTNFVHISLVWNHSDNKYYFYRNGVLVNTTTWTDASINQNRTDTINIGGNIYQWGTNGNYWSGTIAQVSIYNRALTANEVKQNFNATRGRFGI